MNADPATPTATALPHLDYSGWKRVLCIVAHPDDLEYGASAVVATWVNAGIEVTYLLLTAGEAGMQRPPEEAGPLRAAEQREACAIVGAQHLIILDHPDGMLTYGLDLRRDIARVVRQVRPDAVVTTTWAEEAYGGLNQADHRVAGLVAIDGVRDADNAWVFRELAQEEGLPKWHARAFLVASHAAPTHAIPVDADSVDAAVRSLHAHKAYLDDLPAHPKPEDFIPELLADGGRAAGCEHAGLFRVFDLGGIAGE